MDVKIKNRLISRNLGFVRIANCREIDQASTRRRYAMACIPDTRIFPKFQLSMRTAIAIGRQHE